VPPKNKIINDTRKTMSAILAQRPVERRLDIQRIDAPLGAEVISFDIASADDPKVFAGLKQAHLEHQLLIFRDLCISPRQQIDFSRKFGNLQVHVLHQFQLPGHPEIMIISNIKEGGRPIGLGDAGQYWHSDLSYVELPSLGSMLHAQELPDEGGDTLFANMHLAWETLPVHLKKALEGLKAEHSYLKKYAELQSRAPWRPQLTEEQVAQVKPAVHPVVRMHPETGRKTLFVSEHFTTRIVGMSQRESDDLLVQLFEHSVRPEHVYRHRWQQNDMLFWDNRSLLHLAAGCPDHKQRKLYRTTIEGDKPF
jgi:taurine dioxygenase